MLRLTNIRLFDRTVIPDIEVDDGKDAVEDRDMGDLTAVPGYFDSHIHGSFGFDSSDGRAEDIVKLASMLPGFGVSDFLPTLVTLDEDRILKAAGAVAEASDKLGSFEGPHANIAGVRLEGPLLSPGMAGVQNPECLVSADKFSLILEKLENEYPGLVKMIDIAPEIEGAMDLVHRFSDRYVFSLAHSDCDFQKALEFLSSGGKSLTHALNAMRPCLKRDPGPLGAAFDNEDSYVEVICDGIHVDPVVLKMMFRLFDGRIIVISDAVRAAGMPDGYYDLGGISVESRGGRTFFGPSGNLAGSVTSMSQEAERLYSFGIDKETIIRSMTCTPRRRLGISKDNDPGALRRNLNFVDDEMRLMCVISQGRLVSPYVML